MPFGRDGTACCRALIRDWEVGTLVRLRSGQPFSVSSSGYDQSLQVWRRTIRTSRPGASANPVLGGPEQVLRSRRRSACQPAGVIGNAPRNSLIGPGFATWDLMTSRTLTFGDVGQPAAALRGVQPAEPRELRHPVACALQRQRHAAGRRRPHHEHASAPRQAQLGVKFVW